jgi:hypothetical protein
MKSKDELNRFEEQICKSLQIFCQNGRICLDVTESSRTRRDPDPDPQHCVHLYCTSVEQHGAWAAVIYGTCM